MGKRALVTGVTGQDGAYLAQHLLGLGYEVFGAYRRNASASFQRLAELGIEERIKTEAFDLLEYSNIARVIARVQPDEVYNLAAQSFVALSFEQPLFTTDADAMGVTRILEVIRSVNPKIKFYQASTSEMFGKVREIPQTERTPFYPRSPYGVAKLYAHWMTVNYRESYGMFACSGILFNHESPLRGLEFVTRKITVGLARIRAGKQDALELGNLDSQRDWGFAGDYVRGMHLMLQHYRADDYVLATGETHSVRTFIETAGQAAGFTIEWRGAAEHTTGIDTKSGKTVVRVDPRFYRPAEVDLLVGDATKARQHLDWKPEVSFQDLVQQMMAADLTKFG